MENRIGPPPEDELRTAQEALARAELERDVPALRRLIHDDFMGVDPSGALIDKEDVLETYGSGLFVLRTLVVEEQHVRVTGDTGVVTASSIMRGRTPAGEFEQRCRFTDVYVRDRGEWRLFASHVTPLRRSAGFHAVGE
ncbi:MAG TPA: nuclear transport factor 2 family protein [Longimicrobiaceae bacterium]|nr:nuclear transport factor 2 family protein [Longimicrobiaceae bacterium]